MSTETSKRRSDRSASLRPAGIGGALRAVPMVAALVVSVFSAATLTAYDKPLDPQTLTPSVMEFMDGSQVRPVSASRDGGVQARPMLLRYDLGQGAAPVIAWHPWRLTSQEQVPHRELLL